jgi:hypothetical protein
MKTFAIRDEEGRLYAFEVKCHYISLGALTETLSSVESVSNVQRASGASRAEGARINFECGGKSYVVWEPYGDSSRYWVGPMDESEKCGDAQFSAVEVALSEYRTPFIRKVVGDIVSLNVKGLLGREA